MNIFTPWWFGCHINQKLANISSRGPDSKNFGPRGLCGLCCKYSTLQLQWKSSQRQHINKAVWQCSNKTLLTKPGVESDLADGLKSTGPCYTKQICLYSFQLFKWMLKLKYLLMVSVFWFYCRLRANLFTSQGFNFLNYKLRVRWGELRCSNCFFLTKPARYPKKKGRKSWSFWSRACTNSPSLLCHPEGIRAPGISGEIGNYKMMSKIVI